MITTTIIRKKGMSPKKNNLGQNHRREWRRAPHKPSGRAMITHVAWPFTTTSTAVWIETPDPHNHSSGRMGHQRKRKQISISLAKLAMTGWDSEVQNTNAISKLKSVGPPMSDLSPPLHPFCIHLLDPWFMPYPSPDSTVHNLPGEASADSVCISCWGHCKCLYPRLITMLLLNV